MPPTVVIPSALAWVFASLMPAASFALIGVILGEFIGAERGLQVDYRGRSARQCQRDDGGDPSYDGARDAAELRCAFAEIVSAPMAATI